MIPRPIPKKHFQTNQYIKAETLRVVDEAGLVGVMSKTEALRIAAERGVDLIVVAENSNPPVARIIDFSKFKYQQAKKTKAGQTKTKATDIKEVRFTPFMAENDFNTRIERAKEFLTDGHKVKLVVKFVGRQITRKEFGGKQLDRAIAALADISRPEGEPKWQGKLYFILIKPTIKPKPNEKSQS